MIWLFSLVLLIFGVIIGFGFRARLLRYRFFLKHRETLAASWPGGSSYWDDVFRQEMSRQDFDHFCQFCADYLDLRLASLAGICGQPAGKWPVLPYRWLLKTFWRGLPVLFLSTLAVFLWLALAVTLLFLSFLFDPRLTWRLLWEKKNER